MSGFVRGVCVDWPQASVSCGDSLGLLPFICRTRSPPCLGAQFVRDVKTGLAGMSETILTATTPNNHTNTGALYPE